MFIGKNKRRKLNATEKNCCDIKKYKSKNVRSAFGKRTRRKWHDL